MCTITGNLNADVNGGLGRLDILDRVPGLQIDFSNVFVVRNLYKDRDSIVRSKLFGNSKQLIYYRIGDQE